MPEPIRIAETSRLYLREITPDDALSAFELNVDPEVLRYTGDEPFDSVEEARDFLASYPSYKKFGFGRWAVIDKSNGEFLGWCGLKYTPELDEFDLGYRFFKKHWNKGYASEAAVLCIQLAREKYGIKQLVGRVEPENVASIRVLEKQGFSFSEERLSDDHREWIYTLNLDV